MPASYKLKGDLLKMELVGETPPDDLIATFMRAINDPQCPNPVAFLLDVRQSHSLETQPVPEIRRVAEYLGPFAARIGGRAAVVASSDVHFGLSRLGSVYSESVGVEVQVFRDLDSAVTWLGTKP
jgi:hypothetical protein